jgi:hypothetical protein
MQVPDGYSAFQIVKDVVTFLLAVFGALLSGFNFYKAQKRDERQLNIKLGWRMKVLVHGEEQSNTPNLSALVAVVVNTGNRPFQLNRVELMHQESSLDSHSELSDSRDDWENTKLPKKLNEGEEAQFFFFSHWARQMLQKEHKDSRVPLRVVATLSTGERFASRIEKFDVRSAMFPHIGESRFAKTTRL